MAVKQMILVALLATSVLTNPSGSRQCDLSGRWIDEHGHVIQVQQTDDGSISVSQDDPSLKWTGGYGNLTIDTVHLTINGGIGDLLGFVYASCQRIMFKDKGDASWQPENTCPLTFQGFGGGCRWSRIFEHVKKVHLVYMTHWDTTFTDFRRGVCDVYFNDTGKCKSAEPEYCDSGNGHFVDAIHTAEELKKNTSASAPRFRYTSWPWLIKEYLDDTAQCGTTGRSEPEVQRLEKYITQDDIIWNGKALNLLPEMADGALYAYSLNVSTELNSRYNKTWGSLASKSADVAGVSRSIVPYLAKKGITMLHLGYNAKCLTPDIPSIVNWEVEGHRIQLVVSDTYGAETAIEPPGPVHHLDHTVDLGLDEALVFLYTPDNRAPPNASEVQHYWQAIQYQFPNAVIEASSLDDFAKFLTSQQDQFPGFKGEIGDTWLNGGGSDPYRVAKFRTIRRAMNNAIEQGQVQASDPGMQDYNFRLLNHPEHNWGLAGLGKYPNISNYKTCLSGMANCYNNTAFHGVLNRSDYQYFTSSWIEGRNYLHPIQARGHGRNDSIEFDAFIAMLGKQVDQFDKRFRTPPANRELNMRSSATCDNGLEIAFDETTGALVKVEGRNSSLEFGCQNGVPKYKTYNAADYMQFDLFYNAGDELHGDMVGPVSKPGIQHLDLASQYWSPESIRYGIDTAACTAQVRFEMPEEAHREYGSPSSFVVSYFMGYQSQSGSRINVSTTVSWVNKTATRLPESIFVGFQPQVARDSAWKLDVLGYEVDPTSVVINGSRHLHAIQEYIRHPAFTLRSYDVPLVSPGDSDHLLQHRGLVSPDAMNVTKGWFFNLYNNHWGVAFPQWYPYLDDDKNANFVFELLDQ